MSKLPKKCKNPITGVRNFTIYINKQVLPNIPNAVTESTVRRNLIAYECGSGGLVHEPRQNNREPFQIDPTSLDALVDPNCNVWGLENMADYCGMSLRWFKEKRKNGDVPIDWLFGRAYSCTNSLDNVI